MASHIGIPSTPLAAPSGAYIEETTDESTVEVATVRGVTGAVVIAVPKNLVTRNVTIKGKGDPALTAVTAGAMTEGTLKIVSAKGTEHAEEFADFEIKATALSTRA